jgi:GT2 family glycosyltransferase
LPTTQNNLISVVILNYNNKEFLRKCITSVLELDWPEVEVIVVDNASSDGSPDMVEAEFGERTRLIRREQNSPTAGRNQGFDAARGAYILSLDNDIVLPDKTVVRKAVSILERLPKVALLAFKIGTVENPDEPLPEHWWHPLPIEEGKNRCFLTDFFSEGAVFFRAEPLKAAGGYDEQFFQYYEGNDLALRLIRDGHDLLFSPDLACGELRVRGFLHQRRTRINYLALRNKIWIVWKHYPVWRGSWYLLGRIGVGAVRSCRYGWIDLFLRALREGFLAPQGIRAQRRLLGEDAWQRIERIHRGHFAEVPSIPPLG